VDGTGADSSSKMDPGPRTVHTPWSGVVRRSAPPGAQLLVTVPVRPRGRAAPGAEVFGESARGGPRHALVLDETHW